MRFSDFLESHFSFTSEKNRDFKNNPYLCFHLAMILANAVGQTVAHSRALPFFLCLYPKKIRKFGQTLSDAAI